MGAANTLRVILMGFCGLTFKDASELAERLAGGTVLRITKDTAQFLVSAENGELRLKAIPKAAPAA